MAKSINGCELFKIWRKQLTKDFRVYLSMSGKADTAGLD